MVVQHNQPGSTDQSVIRNFCIIAHIDHGKSTVADRILQLSGIVPEREMRDRFLDRMDIEQERGITIKSQAVRVPWTFDGTEYTLGMIDTPGHVDFTYEVSRALAACEGAVLLVDATQGIEAQTLSNLYMAIDHDLAIIPVLNKIDLPSAEPDKHAEEIAGLIGCEPSDVLRVSGKTGEGVADLLDQIVMDVPAPHGDPDAPARALIFDSVYDSYRGIVTYIRMEDGELHDREKVHMMGIGMTHDPIEIGVISPDMTRTKALGAGEVGYIITGAKDVSQSKVGDTLTSAVRPAAEPLPGYRDPKPMVYAGLFPIDNAQFPELRDALDKLKLNDAALIYTPETSVALGFGFRCGFLGLLHMEIVNERLSRVRPRPDPDRPERHLRRDRRGRQPASCDQPERIPGRQNQEDCRADGCRRHHHAQGIHRCGDGSVPGPPWHYGHDGVHLHRSCRDALPHSAGGNRVRLLRPAQVPHQGLRFP